MEPNKRVLLGMSGGTDSSVAALLLQEAGYEVTGVTFRFYEKDDCTEYLDDARDLCLRLGIPHIVSDQREVFQSTIIDYFISEYMNGHTPVPCTLCNNYLKWPLLRQLADEMNIYHLATGHYVQKQYIDGHWHITNGADNDKNQSFFLWGLPQDILERMLLPIGGLTKVRVREIAEERGFMKAARKKDSIGVCFCPMDYRTFLRNNAPTGTIQKGKFVDEKGDFIAWHEGYPFYTIGQRRGLGINLNQALFVKEITPS
ncbi:MAG: tRNA 2-thiouridine(34) synthase MnmA, partial [Rikenellaceae bacterium]|nr:tRNA 2-thiouridine(34) synthase MnmA [Rikenellaceae bacterium]